MKTELKVYQGASFSRTMDNLAEGQRGKSGSDQASDLSYMYGILRVKGKSLGEDHPFTLNPLLAVVLFGWPICLGTRYSGFPPARPGLLVPLT